MSFEPRMRGKRFLRPASKKSKRARDNTPSFVRTIKDKTDPVAVTRNILNAIDHLGNQRFALPPFAEHFQRWLTDLQSLLNEFKNQIPETEGDPFQNEIHEVLMSLQDAFSKHTETERTKSSELTKLQQELAQLEIELSKLERTYRSQSHELRSQYDKSKQKLRGEINSLDKKRIHLLRKKPSIFQRIIRKSRTGLEDTKVELEDKKSKLLDDQLTFEQILQNHRNEYTKNRQKFITNIDLLKEKIENCTKDGGDDALETRKQACQQIHAAIDRAMLNIGLRNLEENKTSQ